MMRKATSAIAALQVPDEPTQNPQVRVVEIPETYGVGWAAQSMRSRHKYDVRLEADPTGPPVLLGPSLDLSTWIADELIYCSHGDESAQFVEAVSESSLRTLEVAVRATI